MNRSIFLTFIFLICYQPTGFSQLLDILDSGGPLMPEQAAYDVKEYNLTLEVFPQDSSIKGFLQTKALIVHPTYWFVLDIDTVFTIESVTELQEGDMVFPRKFHQEIGKLWIDLSSTRCPGEMIHITVNYHGKPRIAKRPPWDGGFTWKQTKDGLPWISTTCQGEGADLWWPNKDHVSDKPDRMGLHITVPEGLVVATNGKLITTKTNNNSTVTYDWQVSTPISNYNISLNIAPYKVIEGALESVSGNTFSVYFWVLPENYEDGKKFFPQILDHLRFFEELLGPYPFQADKYGVVQTPHLGMEHQTIIAYGANFNNGSMTGKDWGYDALHQHELSHEWWGNLVTNSDWRDMWLHEGFGTYMQPLYVEYLHGKEAYHQAMKTMRYFGNTRTIAPREVTSANEIYKAPIYAKGAWILHTLRYLIGDKAFFETLKKMAYPNLDENPVMDGSQVRFATTDDFLTIAEEVSGKELDWFFEVYLRQPELPVLYSLVENGTLKIRWKSPENLPFPMPVEVKIGNEVIRYDIPAEGFTIKLKKGDKPEVDPDHWLLMEISR